MCEEEKLTAQEADKKSDRHRVEVEDKSRPEVHKVLKEHKAQAEDNRDVFGEKSMRLGLLN